VRVHVHVRARVCAWRRRRSQLQKEEDRVRITRANCTRMTRATARPALHNCFQPLSHALALNRHLYHRHPPPSSLLLRLRAAAYIIIDLVAMILLLNHKSCGVPSSALAGMSWSSTGPSCIARRSQTSCQLLYVSIRYSSTPLPLQQ